MRVSSPITPPFSGTFRSARTKTRLPRTPPGSARSDERSLAATRYLPSSSTRSTTRFE